MCYPFIIPPAATTGIFTISIIYLTKLDVLIKLFSTSPIKVPLCPPASPP